MAEETGAPSGAGKSEVAKTVKKPIWQDARLMYAAGAVTLIIAAVILFYPQAGEKPADGAQPPANQTVLHSAADMASAVAAELYALTRYIDLDFGNATLTIDPSMGADAVLTELAIADGYVSAKVTRRSTQEVEIAKATFGDFAIAQGYRLACAPDGKGKFTLSISKRTEYRWDTNTLDLAAVTTLDIEGCGSRIVLKAQTLAESFTSLKSLLGSPEAYLANETWYRFQKYVDKNGVNGSDPGSLIVQAAVAEAPGIIQDFASYLQGEISRYERCEAASLPGDFTLSYKDDKGRFVQKFTPAPGKTAIVWLSFNGARIRCTPVPAAGSGPVVLDTGEYTYEIPGPKFGLNLSKIM